MLSDIDVVTGEGYPGYYKGEWVVDSTGLSLTEDRVAELIDKYPFLTEIDSALTVTAAPDADTKVPSETAEAESAAGEEEE